MRKKMEPHLTQINLVVYESLPEMPLPSVLAGNHHVSSGAQVHSQLALLR